MKLIHPQYLTRLLSAAAHDDAVFTADVGTPTVWAARYLTMTAGRRLIDRSSIGGRAPWPWLWMAAAGLAALLSIPLGHYAEGFVRARLVRRGVWGAATIVYGEGAAELARSLTARPELGLRPIIY